ncbi:MAG: glycosyltransferase family 4 protein [Armatimonadetes bacterium]|nr:glycosyltransferase family 4 protein [Armatimonadota bacterium]
MRILLLTLYFEPDITANAAILTRLAEELAALGHAVSVVTAFPHYAGNRIDPRYRGTLIERARHGDIRVTRTYVYVASDKGSLRARLLNYASFNLLSVVAGLLSPAPDVVLAPSPPLTIGLTAWLLGSLKRVPFVYNVQDIYPDIAIRLGILTNPRAIRAFRRLEDFVYRRAAAVSVLSEGFRQNLLGKGVPPAKLRIIPNFVDPDLVRPQPKENPFARREGLADRFVALYAGNIGLSQGLETLLGACAHLRDLPDFLAVIVGNGAARPALEARAQEMGLSNVRFLPFQPKEDLAMMYASADVSLVLLKRGIGAESVPSKAYAILASGRPILAAVDAGADTDRLIQDARCGVAVPPEDPAALARAIRALRADPAARAQMGRRGREHVVAHYSPGAIARQYEALLRDVVR